MDRGSGGVPRGRTGGGAETSRGEAGRLRRARDRRQLRFSSRRWNWAHILAVAGAVIAGLGLVFTAIGTYATYRVSMDQLEQSQESHQEQERSSAEWLMVWGGEAGGWEQGEKRHIVIANRSKKPAYSVIAFMVSENKKIVAVPLPDFPPCSRIALPLGEIEEGAGTGRSQFRVVSFVDSGGRAWAHPVDGPPWRLDIPEYLAWGRDVVHIMGNREALRLPDHMDVVVVSWGMKLAEVKSESAGVCARD